VPKLTSSSAVLLVAHVERPSRALLDALGFSGERDGRDGSPSVGDPRRIIQ
jgi:hypothetical protein